MPVSAKNRSMPSGRPLFSAAVRWISATMCSLFQPIDDQHIAALALWDELR
jgi:hypothetical protein